MTLINRGNGQANEAAYNQSAQVTLTILDRRRPITAVDWEEYGTLHAGIRAADDSGDWDGAVVLLNGESAAVFADVTADIEARVAS
ncbi:MAG TPA: hypothetical protein PLV68_15960, partial [Ilumatobacteraceae bacterium]|nr:hypothetical protein [Ilumatobacteraceae bacterium]